METSDLFILGVHSPPHIGWSYGGGYNKDCKTISKRIGVKAVDNGQKGHIVARNYDSKILCQLSFGQECLHGVHAEVQDMNWLDDGNRDFNFRCL